MSTSHQFQIVDYLIFGGTIAISVAIGLYYALSGGKQRTTSEYLLAGRKMPFLPVAISLFVSFESSIMMLGLPAETYMFGLQIIVGLLANLAANLLCAWIVAPLLYPLRITSTYEYLEMRFKSRAVRLFGSSLGIMTDLWYMGLVLFGPAVALKAVTGFPIWMSIGGLAVVAVAYTAIGGLKAVIWTDVFQTGIIFAGIFAVLIKGTIVVGGPKAVWNIAEAGGRLDVFNFNFDIWERHNFWNLGISLFIRGFSVGFKQTSLQRICSTPTLKDAKRVMLFMAPASFVVATLASYEGVVAYSYYAKKQCDPFASGQLDDPNQVIPFIVMDMFSFIDGMAGLFLAALFSASLSTLSSCLSGQSALFLTDFVQPVVGEMSERKATLVAKMSVVMFGSIACCIAFLISLIGGTLQQISAVLLSCFAAPLVGIFLLACFSPRSNAKGVIIGGTISLAITMWLSLGMSFTPGLSKTPFLAPASTARCDIDQMAFNETMSLLANQTTRFIKPILSTTMAAMTSSAEHTHQSFTEKLYSISYTWIPIISTSTCIIFGYIFSLCTGANKPGDVDPRYLVPLTDSLLVWLPKSVRRAFSSVGTQFIHLQTSTDSVTVSELEGLQPVTAMSSMTTARC